MDKDNKNEFDLWHCGSYSNGNWKVVFLGGFWERLF